MATNPTTHHRSTFTVYLENGAFLNTLRRKCFNLTSLDMGWVRLEADISPLLERVAPQLFEFSLEETSWANSEHAEKVCLHLPKMKLLKRLNLRKFDESLDALAMLDSGTVEFLDLSECSQLTADPLVHFFEKNPQLLVLHLCPMPYSCLPLIAMSTTSAINLPGPFLGFIRPQKQTKRRYTEEGKLVSKPKKKPKNGTDLQVLINKLATLKRLRTLWLGHIPYSAHFLSLKALSELGELRHLHIKECNSLDGNALGVILKGISPTLRQLSLLNCGQLENFGALSNCQILSQLDIENGMCLQNGDLKVLGMHGNLRILRLKDCPGISDDAVWCVSANCISLKELELIKCAGISDHFLSNAPAFSKLQKLERLSLSGCEGITRHSIVEAVDVLNWDSLVQLDLSKNMNIDNSILLPIWGKLEKQKHYRNNKCLTLHVGGTGIARESDQTELAPHMELMF
ncbi:F-box/LRR-repeat protein 7 [Globodera pallida]|nr:F-box/LRR-repeat protein 7 [Globodera pallida]